MFTLWKNTTMCKSNTKKKIRKVFISIKDPDVRSFNKALNKLKRNGILTKIGILNNEIENFYNSYIIYKRNFIPFVTCKLAVSKDFFTVDKKKKWITNGQSRGVVHLMRSTHDCILTSSKTINDDNPILTCRINGLCKTSPSRIILDKALNIKINSRILIDAKKYKTIVFYNKYKKK